MKFSLDLSALFYMPINVSTLEYHGCKCYTEGCGLCSLLKLRKLYSMAIVKCLVHLDSSKLAFMKLN